MRQWRSFWHTIEFMSQDNPPQLVETLMLALSMLLFSVWIFNSELAYLLLGLVFTVGACASILVREALIPAVRPRPTQVMATLLLGVSLYGFADLLFAR
ncbi:hypothetical protein NIES2135_57020 [Leptolyngbya boryana NIES-2135]|jgi:multisubunit Na+/H+ antiporter MnhE subunit|uniref:Uncharacterized protein n=2 Tax=Leptolyngbya boryana TaxID=1184 RepID=A0A1Z4JQA6_LEPBY|nr:hypothetical protein [Leptolyngbya sp. FACHB-1624]MBD2370431.1 hypothetical protein [Leptolyngbya sp. FACHB-161]MBD2376890.1 hypothetical protein [Leptolyngbya sp. FACHB-238]MBD2401257.1 hypothetical protein [Leptolyngbya sp. FACHB-239]MBD2407808.1 hypothetical protein [Leptolyngbya sp. FACHB-402]BAS55030.1 hypothetical protein LBWT_9330 [Leptolyngbya boryana IAM M-101]BAS61378.1 hypothetical protein LBDG_09330 [Leptolyngbya boryana dg5]BAY58828.1 hypothetical protein NIES2135_57020 [Lept